MENSRTFYLSRCEFKLVHFRSVRQTGAIATSLVSSATSLAMVRESVCLREVEKTQQLAYLNVLLVTNQIQNRRHPDTSV